MYIAEVLDLVCQRRKLEDPKSYALVVDAGDVKMNIPLDRTVKSLQGKKELILMKKTMLREYGVEVRERKGTTDPNGKAFSAFMRAPLIEVMSIASIFTTDVATQEQTLSQMLDFMNAYRVRARYPGVHQQEADIGIRQKYTVYRKMPMIVTRNARMLTIDGGYIHVRPHTSIRLAHR